MEHTKHIWRAVLILIAISIVAVVTRHFVIPASFGAQGFYRYDSVGEYMSKPVVHGAGDACRACHGTISDAEGKGKHATVSCEVCHGPLSNHVKDGAKVADAPIERANSACALCHEKLRARPEQFPQIEIAEHLVSNGVISAGDPIPEDACIVCHDAHNPTSS